MVGMLSDFTALKAGSRPRVWDSLHDTPRSPIRIRQFSMRAYDLVLPDDTPHS